MPVLRTSFSKTLNKMVYITNPWPFVQWGFDLLGTFSKSPKGFEYLMEEMDDLAGGLRLSN